MNSKTKKLLWISFALLTAASVGTVLWVRKFHRYTPAEAIRDLQAAAQVRHSERPVEQFLEVRYGPMTDPANRQKAFLDFFNVGHIEGLQIIVSHMEPRQRETNIAAMAHWIANYRRTMTSEEKRALRATLQANRPMLQHATAQYLRQDVRYRAATAPVISELMTTLNAVERN